MTELKTFKDIWEEAIIANGVDDEWTGDVVARILLRQEAFNWIKYLDGEEGDDCPSCEGMPLPCDKSYHVVTQTWIKHFFNVTDEELK